MDFHVVIASYAYRQALPTAAGTFVAQRCHRSSADPHVTVIFLSHIVGDRNWRNREIVGCRKLSPVVPEESFDAAGKLSPTAFSMAFEVCTEKFTPKLVCREKELSE